MAPVHQEEVSEEEAFGPLPLRNKSAEFLRVGMRQDETGWDVGPFVASVAMLAPGPNSPQATKHKESACMRS